MYVYMYVHGMFGVFGFYPLGPEVKSNPDAFVKILIDVIGIFGKFLRHHSVDPSLVGEIR